MHGAAETRCILLGSALDLSWYLSLSPPLLSIGSEREVTPEPQPERAREEWAVGTRSPETVPFECSEPRCQCKPTAPSKVPTHARIHT
jgi:hypothetical protein